MSYSSFLIANYATGYDKELQPWLLPNDAFTQLTDCYVYRGVLNKRDGYNGFATGKTSTYTESRMVHNVADEVIGAANGILLVFTSTLADIPLRRGSVTITYTIAATPHSVTDNGNGGFTGFDIDSTPANTFVNYTTGAIQITFTVAPDNATNVTVTYDGFQGLPVMGIMSYWPVNDVRQMLVVDTKYVNLYNPATDRLEDISTTTYNGGNSDFWGWVNYADASSNPRLLFCDRVNGDVIQQWDGSTITDYVYTLSGVSTLNARQMFNFNGRLILFQTRENGTLFPKRIRISGIGANCDVFDDTATGAGFIDIDDNNQFFGAALNRNDLLFYTESSSWVMKYTGNDVNPFSLQRLDSSRGSFAAFAVISYLNRTMAASPYGLTLNDGYAIERMDDNLPQFTFNTINDQYFDRCFSAFQDEDRDVYMMYPSVNDERPALVDANASDEILIANFEEDNFCIYNIPLSCMGNFQETINVQWMDLTAAENNANWDAMAANYNNWNAFPFTIASPVSIGGGHKGEIWQMNNTEGLDNPQMIRNITIIATLEPTIQVTTDWNNYELGDSIFFTNVGGMVEINGKQGVIISIDTPFNVFTVEFDEEETGVTLTPWTIGGTANRCIPMVATSKKLNPWIEQDKKVRCGWMYFYVSVTNCENLDITGGQEDTFIDLRVLVGNNEESDFSTTQFRYQINCSNINNQIGKKKWVKIWINQVGQFLQFQMSNNQAGAQIQIHAMMAGFQPIGRLI